MSEPQPGSGVPERISRVQAARLGRTRYFTGNTCSKCGQAAEKMVSSGKCVVCNREKVKVRRKRILAEYRELRA